jgi:16S rRNA processing protein RimM
MVVIGQFAGAHGVRGAFKVRSFTEVPEDIGSYGPVLAQGSSRLTLTLVREVKPALFLATAPEIRSPEDCEPYKGALLSVDRSALPQTDDDDFYIDDLKGLAAITPDGQPAGRVRAVVNFGAGDIVELEDLPDRTGTVLLPFDRTTFPDIDLSGGRITVVLPQPDDSEPVGDTGS